MINKRSSQVHPVFAEILAAIYPGPKEIKQVKAAHLKAEQAMSKLQKIDIEVRELSKI